MKRAMYALLTATSLIALGCVITTKHKIDAHIVLDIRHIQQQADGVLDYIDGKSDKLPAPESKSSVERPGWMERLRYAMLPIVPAYAAELNESTPRIKELADKMRERQPQLNDLKKSGAAGEDNRGYVALRESAALSDADKKNEAQKLIAAENEDRKALYREVARANSDAGATLTVVERVYAQRRLMRAGAGEIVQLPPEGSDFDTFKASAAGKKLGDACKPGEWVTLK
ncbi:MAG: YdbL family protein [Candidatus Hydrogenedentes bacterium]|nr:YdbL family protein [Candidatus Hydrogenedentota bacterium]